MMGDPSKLKSGLKPRHLTMISIAGVIGGALFVGSGTVIYNAGPSAVLAYALGGALVMIIMRMLGEMAFIHPDSGSFSTYADKAIGRWAGFSIGWLYWWHWALLLGWEAYVAGGILHAWFPIIPIWAFMLLIAISLVLVNFLDVKNYGEFEFWFASIKVVAIVVFIIIGCLAIAHLWPWGNHQIYGFKQLTGQGFMPNGFPSVVTALLVSCLLILVLKLSPSPRANLKIHDMRCVKPLNQWCGELLYSMSAPFLLRYASSHIIIHYSKIQLGVHTA